MSDAGEEDPEGIRGHASLRDLRLAFGVEHAQELGARAGVLAEAADHLAGDH